MNKRYYVQIPVTGVIGVEVKAANKEEALEVALESATLTEIEEWETHETVCKGNVFCGLLNQYEVEEVE